MIVVCTLGGSTRRSVRAFVTPAGNFVLDLLITRGVRRQLGAVARNAPHLGLGFVTSRCVIGLLFFCCIGYVARVSLKRRAAHRVIVGCGSMA